MFSTCKHARTCMYTHMHIQVWSLPPLCGSLLDLAPAAVAAGRAALCAYFCNKVRCGIPWAPSALECRWCKCVKGGGGAGSFSNRISYKNMWLGGWVVIQCV